MGVPTSGSLGITTCPSAIACTAIAQVVCGTTTGTFSLATLSTCAGKTAPHAMSEFYNFDNFTINCTLSTGISSSGAVIDTLVIAPPNITYSVSNGGSTWLITNAPTTPSMAGVNHGTVVSSNAGAARSGTVCYTPTYGTVRCHTYCQLCGTTIRPLYFTSLYNCVCTCCAVRCARLDGLCTGHCVGLSMAFQVTKGAGTLTTACSIMTCAGSVKYSCCLTTAGACDVRSVFPTFVVAFGTAVCMRYRGSVSIPATQYSCVGLGINCIIQCGTGCYCIGSPLGYQAVVGTP